MQFAAQYAPPVVQFPPNQGALHVPTAAGVLPNALPAYTSTPGLVNAEIEGEEAPLLPTASSLPEPKDNGVAQEIKTMKEAIKSVQGISRYGNMNLTQLCFYPEHPWPDKFKVPDFAKYDGEPGRLSKTLRRSPLRAFK